jgi:hypothetical protein
MKKTIKKMIKQVIPNRLVNIIKTTENHETILKNWIKLGCSVPPPHVVKQLTVEGYQKMFGYDTLIETGTYLGDMVDAQKKYFEKIISIELSPELSKKAAKRFSGNKKILIVQGDSGKTLPGILKTISQPSIFWLDGHYSDGITARGEKDCPVIEELQAIFGSKPLNHIILIDDARCFNGKGDYPKIETLTELIQKWNPKYKCEVKHDIIRYVIY